MDQKQFSFLTILTIFLEKLPEGEREKVASQIDSLLTQSMVVSVANSLPEAEKTAFSAKITEAVKNKQPVDQIIEPYLEKEEIRKTVTDNLLKAGEHILQAFEASIVKPA